jgi:hypothetical protein
MLDVTPLNTINNTVTANACYERALSAIVPFMGDIMDTKFYWGWKDYAKLPDTSMTRARMAKLMRAWRNASTQGKREFMFKLVSRENGKRDYFVSTTKYINDDFANFSVCTK